MSEPTKRELVEAIGRIQHLIGIANELRAENERLTKSETEIRKQVWLAHGHDGLYGDDGEMQCGTCVVDFKLEPAEGIAAALLDAVRQHQQAALSEKGNADRLEKERDERWFPLLEAFVEWEEGNKRDPTMADHSTCKRSECQLAEVHYHMDRCQEIREREVSDG